LDEEQIRINFGRARGRADAWQAGLCQHPGDRVTVNMHLPGDRADAPLFGMVITQDLRLDVRGDGHGGILSGWSRNPGGVAERCVGQTPGSGDRSDGNAIAADRSCPPMLIPSRPPPGSLPTDHPFDPEVNPDASRYFFALGSAGLAPHD
jgi:hypothetical protein